LYWSWPSGERQLGESALERNARLFVECDSRIAESLAALYAVLFSKSLELRDVNFEGDSS
jgi:hypothetical protein